MPPNLRGLNVIHPSPPASNDHDLLNVPDLSAQLELWTHLAFESEDGKEIHRKPQQQSPSISHPESVFDDDGEHSSDSRQSIDRRPSPGGDPLSAFSSNQPHTQFDFNSFLAAAFPYGIPHQTQHPPPPPPPPQQPQQTVPSLAQLLALHMPPPGTVPPPLNVPNSVNASPQQKRPRIDSVDSASYSPISASSSTVGQHLLPPINTTVSQPAQSQQGSVTPVSASDDKRRRNTAASARFRLKKKEREAALESKAKELENRVNELERECEGLRRENGWLKGLVVGVTGVAPPSMTGATPQILAGAKRARDGDD
ncbi:hypothetical protein FISHEDRAFT_71769 [Fistulina hepatica ATCC 64428]|uniref:BZIP domain-containing protein n=1 Tax=Fistulina hepatica ATCC 64428 TaxID=1128425 RepID=A0A0D7AH32_9AGAR|nr:hypothetical protein FISHEDRAFT_71769 [Fistulina hepatica ATCC 64428]